MPRERAAQHKPLSFSTTMRNPARIAGFLDCVLPFEGACLTNTVTTQVTSLLIQRKLYQPMYIAKTPRLKAVLDEERDFTFAEVGEIMRNSPQDHKEAGFDRGWPSRFDTWYKLAMEFGFIYYEMGQPIKISAAGHMLIDASGGAPAGDELIKNSRIFLSAAR